MATKFSGLTAAVVGDLSATTAITAVSINVTTVPLSRKITLGVLRDFLASAATGFASVAVTVASLAFATTLLSTTAFATPAALGATQFTAYASATRGAALMGYGSTYDVALVNRAGTTVFGVLANTLNLSAAGSIAAAVGSAAAPTYTFAGATTTGMYLTQAGDPDPRGAGQLGFAQNGHYVASLSFTQGIYQQAELALGTGQALSDGLYASQYYPVRIYANSVTQTGANSTWIQLDIGGATLTATDTATRVDQFTNQEFDFTRFTAAGGAVTFNSVVNSRFRFACPDTNVTFVDNIGLDFVPAGALPSFHGTVTNLIAINIPLLDQYSEATNYYGMLFRNTPNGGSLAVAANHTLDFNTLGTSPTLDLIRFRNGGVTQMQIASTGITFQQIPIFNSVIAVGGVANTGIGINLTTSNLVGTSPTGIVSAPVFPATATGNAGAISAQFVTAAASFTASSGFGIRIVAPSIGAGSAVTLLYGLLIDNIAGGGTSYAIKTGSGLVSFGGNVSTTGSTAAQAGFSFTGPDATTQTLYRYQGGSNNPGVFVKTNEASSYTSIFGSGSGGALGLWLGAGGVEGILKLTSTTATLATAITTAAPTTGTAGAWKLGILVTAAVVPDTTRYIQLDVGGVLYKLIVST